ncbi:putative Transcription initiation factor iie, alpha subunit [Zostera marina]|uniref:Putative Transcription initiation factor iie, alpha subunit n=1 Tax=Zostera marina TaxID=29655 RepID=A0A0K9Q0L1_ZOSMR|nr:putative Transcription initiation factor iie, alpha subunit [Zostera marina]
MATTKEPFKKLVRLVGRVFYDCSIGSKKRRGRLGDNSRVNVVVLDALTRRQWTTIDDFAKSLKMNKKMLQEIMKFFEKEMFISKAIIKKKRNETVDIISGYKPKMSKISYYCLDYSQIYDVVRYRIFKMIKKIEDELANKITIQDLKYICPNCNRNYSFLDASYLVSSSGQYFECELCKTELIKKWENENTRNKHQKLREMLQKIQIQLKPLLQQIDIMKDLACPEIDSPSASSSSTYLVDEKESYSDKSIEKKDEESNI